MVRECIEQHVDTHALEAIKLTETLERATLQTYLDNLNGNGTAVLSE